MPYIDPAAAAQLKQLRESRGFSPETLAAKITARARREGWEIGTVDAFTIRRIEGNERRHGRPPGIRVKVVLETYFETMIFRPENRIWVADDRRKLVAA